MIKDFMSKKMKNKKNKKLTSGQWNWTESWNITKDKIWKSMKYYKRLNLTKYKIIVKMKYDTNSI